MSKMTPAQHALWRQLLFPQDHYDNGIPLDQIRGTAVKKTIASLERRGLAVVMADRLYAYRPSS